MRKERGEGEEWEEEVEMNPPPSHTHINKQEKTGDILGTHKNTRPGSFPISQHHWSENKVLDLLLLLFTIGVRDEDVWIPAMLHHTEDDDDGGSGGLLLCFCKGCGPCRTGRRSRSRSRSR